MYGLIGKKLSHSFSKEIHETLNENIEYDLIELSELNTFFHDKKFKGLNVTIPYKQEVIQYLDEVSSEAKYINAVNTVINNNGKLHGYNTDIYGLSFMLDYYNISVENQVVGVLGNGSTKNTIEYYCKKHNAQEIRVFARNPKDGEFPISELVNFIEMNVLFNATPVGMYPKNDTSFQFKLSEFNQMKSVVDLVYNPLRTNLIIDAENNNLKTCNGLLMLVAQAVEAARLFYDKSYKDEDIISIYKNTLLKTLSFVFIGMPMSGKSYFTKLVGNVYDKEIVELDSEIEKHAKMSIESIFQISGETHFRTLENECVQNIYKSHNLAVSSGGGIIVTPDNIFKLKQNGIIIFLDVPLDNLLTFKSKKRPLITSPESVINLYNKRYQLYVDASDVIVNKTTLIDEENLSKLEVKLNEYINN